MNEAEAIEALDAIDGGDPESAHCEADDVLLKSVPWAVAEAYRRVTERAEDWWFA